MITLTFNEDQLAAIHQVDVNLAHAAPDIRRKLLSSLSKKVIDFSQRHTHTQTDLKGQPYAPHKRGRQRKMLTRLAQRLKITGINENEAVIGFNNAMEGLIGYRQQYGYKQKHTAGEQMSAARFAGRVSLNSDAPATRRQAKRLLAAGYKVKKAGQAYRTPTIKWIIENLSIKRAGLILRLIRGTAAESWITELPPRSFLGVTDSEKTALINIALAESTALLNAALQPRSDALTELLRRRNL
jgi:hypothetical protein